MSVKAKAKTVVATHHPDRIFYQPLSHVLAQSFTGKPATPSNPYPGVQKACNLANQVGVTKNPLNLKGVENIKGYHKFIEDTNVYKNAVASSSSTQVEDLPAHKSSIMDRISMP